MAARGFLRALVGFFLTLAATTGARADGEALLLVDAATGQVLLDEKGGHPWVPASLTKMMTAYTTLRAIRERKVSPDTLATVSALAARQSPSKMGFRAGTQVTIENALLMLMVKSANDMAVALAERVGGSVPVFVGQMNAHARRLGMTQTTFVNPNGLPATGQVTSPRDMAILARAMLREFPDFEPVWSTPAIKIGERTMRNFNFLIDRYPGAAGMKTGFVCASGFNLVGVAKRGNRTLIAVVMGASSGRDRAEKAAEILEKGFDGEARSTGATLATMRTVVAAAPNLRGEVCGPGRNINRETAEDEASFALNPNAPNPEDNFAFINVPQPRRTAATAEPAAPRQARGWSPLLASYTPSGEPVTVYTGATRSPGSSPIMVAGVRPPATPAPTPAPAPVVATPAPAAPPPATPAVAVAPRPAAPGQIPPVAASAAAPAPAPAGPTAALSWFPGAQALRPAQAAPQAAVPAAAPPASAPLGPTPVRTIAITPPQANAAPPQAAPAPVTAGTPAPGIPVPRPRPRI